jgi:hypothetical protein
MAVVSGWGVGLTALPPSCADCLALSLTLLEPSGHVQELFFNQKGEVCLTACLVLTKNSYVVYFLYRAASFKLKSDAFRYFAISLCKWLSQR